MSGREADTDAKPPATRGWFRSAAGFGVASLLSDTGHEAASSALPALLVTLGAPTFALGLIEGVADGLASFAKLIGGWTAEAPRRRRPLAVAGYLLTGLSTGTYALATSWVHLLFARLAGWVARGVRGPVRDAMLADAVAPEARGRAFGFHRAMDSTGAVLGPALAALILSTWGLHAVFWWSLLPGILSAVAFAALVSPSRLVRVSAPPAFWPSLGALPASFRRFLVAAFAFGVGDFARTLLILRATRLLSPLLGPVRGPAVAMMLYLGHNAVYAVASYPVGWLADRVNPLRLMVSGYALGMVTGVLGAVATPSLWLLAALFGAGGLTLAFTDTLEGTITAFLVPSDQRATAYGVLATANGVGDFLSSILVGALWSAIGPGVAFGTAALLCALGISLQAFVWRGAVVRTR